MSLARIEKVPALIRQERRRLALIVDPEEMAAAERRAAAIAPARASRASAAG